MAFRIADCVELCFGVRPDCEPDQAVRLPAAPSDWLPTGRLASFINEAVDARDINAFCALCG